MTADHASTELDHSTRNTSSPLQGGESDARRCGREKADGTLCKAFKVKGRDACAGHLGLGIGSDPSAHARASHASRQEQAETRRKRLRDALADAVEGELYEDIVAAYRDALRNGEPGERLRAAEQLISRVYGKPKETVETVQKPEEIRRLEEMSDEEFFAEWARFQAEQT